MDMVMDGAITAATDIITGGAEGVATIMVGGIIAITGDLSSISSERPLHWAASFVSSRPGNVAFWQALFGHAETA